MDVKAQTLVIERRGRFRPEVVISYPQGGATTIVDRRLVRVPDGTEYRIEARGVCRRAYSLRTLEGRLAAAAIPFRVLCRGIAGK